MYFVYNNVMFENIFLLTIWFHLSELVMFFHERPKLVFEFNVEL